MTGPVARLAADPADLAAAYAVRHRVFVLEQRVPPELERDADDELAEHAVGLLDNVIVAAGRLLRRGQVGLVGRMAVLPAGRGAGVGAAVLRLLEERARNWGLSTVELHAQLAARAFYERAGYRAYGEEYEEAGIAHVSMRKPLTG